MKSTLDSRFRGNDGSRLDARRSLPSNGLIGGGNDKDCNCLVKFKGLWS